VGLQLAVEKRVPVGIFSMEMPKQKLMYRFIANLSGISVRDIETNHLDEDDWKKIKKALDILRQAPLFISDEPHMNEVTFMSKARTAAFKHGIQFMIVDYLQLMDGKGINATEQVGNLAKTVRKTTRHLNIPCIEISQLSRAVESRSDRRPILSDLRDSGAIEQEADVVIGMYRDEYYNKAKSKLPGMAEAIVMKHREGDLGTAYLYFDRTRQRFKALPAA